MKIMVVGPGAMGTLFAGLLAAGGHEVWLRGRRPEVAETITREGVVIIRSDGSQRRIPVRAIVEVEPAGTVELVLICVKSYSTLQAGKDILPALGSATLVLTLQNGLDNVNILASVVGGERVIAGVTAQGATRLGPGLIRHGGEGDTIIGELDGRETDRLLRVVGAFRQAGVAVETSRSVSSLLWGKLVVNAAINPLTALLRVRNGELLEREDTRALMAVVAREVATVAEARGVRLPYADPVARVEAVCRVTGPNRSSMLQDVERGIQTEVDYLNGAVVREGEAAGVPTPVNWALTRLVKAIGGST